MGAVAKQENQSHRWTVLEDQNSGRDFYVAGEGFNLLVRAERDHVAAMVFAGDKLADPVVGLFADWREVGSPTLAGAARFDFDAGGPFGCIDVNEAIRVIVEVGQEGVSLSMSASPVRVGSGGNVMSRSAFAPWEDIREAEDGPGIIDDLQALYRAIVGS